MTNGQQPKVKGVADIVFLIDATGSMKKCIDALKNNLNVFIDFLEKGKGNEISPVRDWRARVVGFRDFEEDADPFVDNPFVRDTSTLKAQLANLEAKGGGGEPESLLDALYKVANTGETTKDAPEDPSKWRYHRSAARVVIVFTDAPYKEKMAIAEAKGGDVNDVRNAVTGAGIYLSVFAPAHPAYNEIAVFDRTEYLPIKDDMGLEKFTADLANFRATLEQLAASVSASAPVATA